MIKLIEVAHSTYGLVKLSVEKSDYNTLLFKRANGSFMGEMDCDGGGNLSHPNEDVATFISLVLRKNLVEVDEDGYCKLEDILFEFCDEAFPGYFNEAENVPL